MLATVVRHTLVNNLAPILRVKYGSILATNIDSLSSKTRCSCPCGGCTHIIHHKVHKIDLALMGIRIKRNNQDYCIIDIDSQEKYNNYLFLILITWVLTLLVSIILGHSLHHKMYPVVLWRVGT